MDGARRLSLLGIDGRHRPVTVDVELESEVDPNSIRVQTEEGKPLPFTLEGKALRFFTGAPGVVRVLTGDRELVYSLTLPQPGDTVWKPSNVKLGLPGRAPIGPTSRDLWHWLAIAGALGLLADWILFGRSDRRLRAAKGATLESENLEESLMTFERAWVLIFLLLPLGWMIFEWRTTRRVVALVLKTLAFLAIILALAEPTLTVPQTKMAVAVLVDTSSSVSATRPDPRFTIHLGSRQGSRTPLGARAAVRCPISSRSWDQRAGWSSSGAHGGRSRAGYRSGIEH